MKLFVTGIFIAILMYVCSYVWKSLFNVLVIQFLILLFIFPKKKGVSQFYYLKLVNSEKAQRMFETDQFWQKLKLQGLKVIDFKFWESNGDFGKQVFEGRDIFT